MFSDCDLLLDGANVVAAVEDVDVEVFRGARREQAQLVHRLPAVADDRHVGRARRPRSCSPVQTWLELSVDLALVLNPAVERNDDRFFGMLDLEGRAVGLPAVRLLALEAVDDLLPEQAVLVVDAVAVARHAERRQRFQEAGCQPAQAAVAQAGVGLALQHLVEADAEAGQHLAAAAPPTRRLRQVVAQQRPIRNSIER